ncbi:MAG TPA: hypothetical protein VFA07_02660 [Chthonomonadaceae bacterium]|nr:hypothetical protein [Chthonomonadaceae bacterium]
MRMEKKKVLKEDGRYLIYYHFPETATPEQTGTFNAIAASVTSEGDTEAPKTPRMEAGSAPAPTFPPNEDERRV